MAAYVPRASRSQSDLPRRRILFALYPVVAFMIVLLLLASSASAETETITVTPKANDNRTYTSIKMVTWVAGTVVAIPGFNCVPDATFPNGGPTTWTCTGGSLTRANPAVISLTKNGGTPSGKVHSYDYVDKNGNTVWVGACFDPMGYRVVEGGPTGVMYLGYAIPANEYGYFYQLYLAADAPAAIETVDIILGNALGNSTDAYNFQVLGNSFDTDPVPGFDLGDLELPLDTMPDGFVYEVVPYMEEDDATGLPGIDPVWTFDAVNGVARMDFTGLGGLQPGQTASIVAYTSPQPPVLMAADPNVTGTYEGGIDPPCTRNPNTLTPLNRHNTIPTLSEWGAMIFGCLLLVGVLFYVVRRRKMAGQIV